MEVGKFVRQNAFPILRGLRESCEVGIKVSGVADEYSSRAVAILYLACPGSLVGWGGGVFFFPQIWWDEIERPESFCLSL